MAIPNNDKDSATFLITEYNQIADETKRLRSEGLNRLNFFITITSSTLAGLVVLSQSNTATMTVQLISLGAIVFLMLLGWNTFRFIISRDINTDFNLRAMGRISRFFIDRDPSLAQYLSWQKDDEPTKWVTRNSSSLRSSAQFIFCSLLALLCSIFVYMFRDLIWSLTGGFFGFFVGLFTLRTYAERRFRQAERMAAKQVKFARSGLPTQTLSREIPPS